MRDAILNIKEVAKTADWVVDLDDLSASGGSFPARSSLGIATHLGALCFLRHVRSINQSLCVFSHYLRAVRCASERSALRRRCRRVDDRGLRRIVRRLNRCRNNSPFFLWVLLSVVPTCEKKQCRGNMCDSIKNLHSLPLPGRSAQRMVSKENPTEAPHSFSSRGKTRICRWLGHDSARCVAPAASILTSCQPCFT